MVPRAIDNRIQRGGGRESGLTRRLGRRANFKFSHYYCVWPMVWPWVLEWGHEGCLFPHAIARRSNFSSNERFHLVHIQLPESEGKMMRNLCSRLPRSHSSLPAALLMPARPAHRAFTASGRRGAAPDAAAAAAAAVKPRATGGTVTSKRKRHYYLAALIGGPLVFVGYLAYSESERRLPLMAHRLELGSPGHCFLLCGRATAFLSAASPPLVVQQLPF